MDILTSSLDIQIVDMASGQNPTLDAHRSGRENGGDWWLALSLLLDQFINRADVRDAKKLRCHVERRLPDAEVSPVK